MLENWILTREKQGMKLMDDKMVIKEEERRLNMIRFACEQQQKQQKILRIGDQKVKHIP